MPRQFGPYWLKQKIASGGMAALYLAETHGSEGFSKPVVIKMIHDAFSDDERFMARFTAEAAILSSLTHTHIVPILDFGREEGLLYLAMEFVDGVDVATFIEVCRLRGISLPLEIAVFIGEAIAAGLSHVHEAKAQDGKPQGVVHRDVSPQNILLSRAGEVKLCDFGLAATALEVAALDDEICGKLRYLSPEQAHGRMADSRSDLFSLGVVLYEMAAGHHPVPFGTEVTVLQELLEGTGYRSLGEAAPWIAPAVVFTIDRAIAFDPNDRFQSAEEMREALSIILRYDFPDLSQQDLAALVVRAQETGRASPAINTGRTAATIASSDRTYDDKKQIPGSEQRGAESRTRLRRGVIGLLGIAALVALAALLWPRPKPQAMDKAQSVHVAQPPGTARPAAQNVFKPNPAEMGTPHIAANQAAPTAKPTALEPAEPASSAAESHNREKSPVSPKLKEFGTVNINASPWADVSIDGVDYTATPILGLKLRAGKHKATFVNPEIGVTKTKVFVVEADETVRVLVEME